MRIIRHYGRPMEFIDRNGKRVERKDRIFLKSHHTWYETMEYDNHFVYETKSLGSSVLCTCGSIAVTVNYDMYQQYVSSNRGPMLVCQYHIEHGVHADGSH